MNLEPRKTPSLFGNVLRSALKHAQPKLRSESLPEYRRFYVNSGAIERIHNNDSHLIVGRRGTGKTHLLGAFNEMIQQDYPAELSFMFSLSKLDEISYTPSDSPFIDNKHQAHGLFQDFLRKIFPLFLDEADKRMGHLKSILPSKKYIQKFTSINDLLTKLLETIELGKPVVIESFKTETIETKSVQANEARAGLTLGFEKNKPHAGIGIGLSKGKEGEDSDSIKHQIMSVYKCDYIEAGRLIEEIVSELNVDVLHILIDEWMELDKRTPSGIQPVFAQLLKKTFFNSKYISVKIATVWHQTSLYDRKSMEKSQGIELKHDIIRSIDLDTAFLTNERDVFNFCKELLYRRLLYACEEGEIDTSNNLDSLRVKIKDHEEIDDIFIDELFDNIQNYKTFITSSHGIPRDLMDIFHKGQLEIKGNFHNFAITHHIVHSISRNSFKIDKRKTVLPGSSAHKLHALINTYMDNTGHRLFLIKNAQIPSSDALQKLVDEELIHQVPSAVTHRSICDSHKSFLIDFGNFVDHIEAKKRDIESLLNESVLAQFPEGFENCIEDYELNIEGIGNDFIECPECGKTFHKLEPVFVKARMCKHCAHIFNEPQSEQDGSGNA